jgi:hypothetical protein
VVHGLFHENLFTTKRTKGTKKTERNVLSQRREARQEHQKTVYRAGHARRPDRAQFRWRPWSALCSEAFLACFASLREEYPLMSFFAPFVRLVVKHDQG